jgi:hypothetical protein
MCSELVIIDTSILLELLNVPNKANNSEKTWNLFFERKKTGALFFIPLAVIFETGNHIAQNGDGRQRRSCALMFCNFIKKTLEGESPFMLVDFFDKDELACWLNEFPDFSITGKGFGDLSICKDAMKLHEKFPNDKIYIWTLDGHLDSFSIQ